MSSSSRPRATGRGPQRAAIFAALIVAAGALAYSNSLRGPFIWDDQLTVLENQQIRSLRLPDVLMPEREFPTAGRPLVNVTFALNYAAGALDVTGYHVVNLAFHLACALLLFGLARRALALPVLPAPVQASATELAFAMAAIWVVHPLNTEAVNYVTQRTELMMAFFYLLTIYARTRTIKVRATGTSGSVTWGEPLWLAIAVIACAAGMACKESMATAPVMVVLFDAVLVFGSLAAALRARWPLYVSLAATWILLAVLMASGPRIHSAGLDSGMTPWAYLLDQPEVIVHYLRLTFWPHDLIGLYGYPQLTSLLQVWPYALVVVALLALTILAMVKRPALGLLGAWFFITLAPASSVVPIATEVGAERRMYLPLMALVAGISIIPWAEPLRLGSRTMKVRATCWTTIALIVVALGATTFARNRDYTSLLRLAESSVNRRPNDLGRHALGVALVDAGRVDDGIPLLERATATNPRAYYDLGTIYFHQKRWDDALRALEQFVEKEPMRLEVVDSRVRMGRIYFQRQQWAAAIKQYEEVLRMSPGHGEARLQLAASLVNHGTTLVAGGHPKDAIDVFERAARINPASWEALHNLTVAYFDAGDMQRAADLARQALALDANDAVARDVLREATARR